MPRCWHPRERIVPLICVASPVICYLLSAYASARWNYHFGYELLLMNGGLTALALWMASRRIDSGKTSAER